MRWDNIGPVRRTEPKIVAAVMKILTEPERWVCVAGMACLVCDGHGRLKTKARNWLGCEACGGNGWANGKYPFNS